MSSSSITTNALHCYSVSCHFGDIMSLGFCSSVPGLDISYSLVLTCTINKKLVAFMSVTSALCIPSKPVSLASPRISGLRAHRQCDEPCDLHSLHPAHRIYGTTVNVHYLDQSSSCACSLLGPCVPKTHANPRGSVDVVVSSEQTLRELQAGYLFFRYFHSET